ncbi:hypothetical protein MTR67_031114 [Solanum verrucosum]|uniref:Chromo domain-containing protein n=1 Tax=Solanum verrucosum TaxID=315347 RepID=A0AAF0ZH44_SOLVR|nr:hypothetical protein MTR67_031114 [Solanum verrucosum]
MPNELALVHQVFHVSMLKKCISDSVTIIPLEGLGVDESLSYEEIPVEILDRQVRRLRNKEVVSVKVLWRNELVKGSKWEAEADMKSVYPHIFLLLLFKLESQISSRSVQDQSKISPRSVPLLVFEIAI